MKDVCTKNIVYASHDTLLYDAIRIMHERRIRHLVVVGDRMQLKGIVTQMEKQLAIADRNNQLLSMVMLDIDNFKYFNDTNGHEAGVWH